MYFIPSFILFLLSIYSQVGPGTGFPRDNPDQHQYDIKRGIGRHLLETTTETPTSAPPPAEDTGFFASISKFYSNKNNMAMYLVLPIIVLLYGGCSSIYCFAKCRRYFRKRKQKRQAEDEEHLTENEPNNLNLSAGIDNYNQNKTANNINTSPGASFVRKNSTPLPWQVPNDTTEAEVHKTKSPAAQWDHKENRVHSSFDPDTPTSSEQRKPPPINRPPIPIEMIPIPKDEDGIPKRSLPQGHKTYSSRFPDIDQPSPFGQHAPIRRVESPEGIPQRKVLKTPNKELIEAALRPSSSGRESVSTIAMKDELLARFDAFSSFAMAKKAADILRVNTMGGDKKEYVKPKNKLIFIAE